jgi:Tat protein translocase TatB subunit
MFNLGFSELIVVCVIALIFIGPKQLPEVARMIGRLLNEWKRATSDLKSTLTEDFKDDIKVRREAGVPKVPTPDTTEGPPPIPAPKDPKT